MTAEIVAFIRGTRDGRQDDDEKKATSPLSYIVHRRVHIESRWQKQDEIDAMISLVDHLPQPIQRLTASVWCDSRMGCCYRIGIHRPPNVCDHTYGALAETAGAAAAYWLIILFGGYNDLTVGEGGENVPPFGGKSLAEFGCFWNEPYCACPDPGRDCPNRDDDGAGT